MLEKDISTGKNLEKSWNSKPDSWNFEFLVCLRNIRRRYLARLECKKTVPDLAVIFSNAVTSVVVVVVIVVVVVVVVTSVIDLVCECS